MKQKDLLFLLTSSTFVVLIWIVFSILHSSLTSTISEGVAQDIAPIPGAFDTRELTSLKQRLGVTPQTGVAISPTPTPTPTPPQISPVQAIQTLTIPLATQSGTPATQGGKTQ